MFHPYSQLPPTAFWRSAVADSNPAKAEAMFNPKFVLGQGESIATAGSCFAQHVGRRLKRAGLGVLDLEPAPRGAPVMVARDFGYGVYSARYGNIYTARQFVQLLRDAITGMVDAAFVWDRNGRFYDAFRPGIEPGGFASVQEVLTLRRAHLDTVHRVFSQASCVFFTLGLSECWVERSSGRVFPVCPGVVAGDFDPQAHGLLGLNCAETLADLQELRGLLQQLNPQAKMILTVSPVPLTATASGEHVLVATAQSKAVLRAAAGEFSLSHPDVDYFPSYEIVTNPAAMGSFFRPNLREVADRGIDAVMAAFFAAHGLHDPDAFVTYGASYRPAEGEGLDSDSPEDEAMCEEILKDAFWP